MSHPKFDYAMDLLYELNSHFGGVWIPVSNGYKKTDDIVEIIAELMSEYDDLYEKIQDEKVEGNTLCTS